MRKSRTICCEAMDQPASYDEDFLAWSEQQAAVLRELAGRRGLPNELDLEHVAEEIEDLGRAEFNAVKSYIRQILAHPYQSRVRALGRRDLTLAQGGGRLPQRPSRCVHAIHGAED